MDLAYILRASLHQQMLGPHHVSGTSKFLRTQGTVKNRADLGPALADLCLVKGRQGVKKQTMQITNRCY